MNNARLDRQRAQEAYKQAADQTDQLDKALKAAFERGDFAECDRLRGHAQQANERCLALLMEYGPFDDD